MRRYFFHLENRRRIQDMEGERCRTLADAKAHAEAVARELRRNSDLGRFAGMYLCVADENGEELFRLPLNTLR